MAVGISLVVAGSSLVVSVVGLLLEHRSRVRAVALLRHQAVERARARVVVKTHGIEVANGFHTVSATVLNAGPSVAREVDLSILKDSAGTAMLESLAEVEVSRAMIAGDQQTVSLQVPSDVARADDLDMYLSWIDGNGAHNERNVILLKGDSAQGVPVSDWDVGDEPWSTVPEA